jgi:hypothetical protein
MTSSEIAIALNRYFETRREERYRLDCLSIPSRKSGYSNYRGPMFNFDREYRHAVILFEDIHEIRQINEYLINYSNERARVLDFHRQRLVHPFGDVDRFTLMYRHLAFFRSWLGSAMEVPRYRWPVPLRLIHRFPATTVSYDYSSFLQQIDEICETGSMPNRLDPEFEADVKDLGGAKIVVYDNDDFYIESDHAPTPDWLSKWTLMKLRWT